MARIKITQPGWAGFTGEIGITLFKDGISVDHVGRREIVKIGASLSLIEVDDEGDEGENPALQHRMLTDGSMSIPAEVLTPLARASDEPSVPAAPRAAKAVDPTTITFHTKDELEKLAETKGLAGLRAIMDPLNIKAVSINKAIQVILKAELRLKAELEHAGHLVREDQANAGASTPNEVVEGEDDKAGEQGGEQNGQQDGQQDGESSEEAETDEDGKPKATTPPSAKNTDAGPGADGSEQA
ncbi:hypothetical protein ABID82_005146 [Methylobacterium sp. PvP062]|uniref:Mu-like prophage FluMu N-terminal domain-containing protein n=1 Tax=Methylobacterium radiotolerans TaxID=31998 RepID=A0ABV2NUD6_9HYPH|nr:MULTISPECIES: hypothetical protein [unclassified Methylobacterium]MBP2498255.1 hypothetical protein [Methylobacterium sp. PvP105]MBP2505639.1 hypothetical protein [Methylobacterium sp. PvP109]